MTTEPADIREALSAPVIAVDWHAELRSVRATDAYGTANHTARTLAKHGAMRVVLVAIKADGRMERHQTESVISVHCLEGSFRFDVAGAPHVMTPGSVLVVTGRQPHSVTAVEECAFLLTMSEPHSAAAASADAT